MGTGLKTVGILGGMGPEATIDLMRRVMAGRQVTDDADHIPLIVDQNPQVPSRIAHLIDGTGEDPGPVLQAMARRLHGAGAQALAMPCNTAHHYADRIREAVTIPLIDMVAQTAAEAAATGASEVGLLGSPAIRITGVFDRALAEAGLRAVYPEDQDALLRAIRLVKTEGVNDISTAIMRAASDSIGTPVQIVACTEFSLIGDRLPHRVRGIDTLDVLARAIIRFSTEG